MPTNKPLCIAVLGARGSGKSSWLKQTLADHPPLRLVVWDPMREYSAFATPVTSMVGLIETMKETAWRVAYQPNPERDMTEAFEVLCRAVKAARNCVLVVEELAFVTKPSKAPPAWRQLSLLGRHWGVSLVGVSARPASMDKDFIGVCDVIHSGRLATEGDAAAVAPFLGCNWRDLTELPDLHWIERRTGEGGETRRGVLSFAKSEKKSTAKTSTKGAGAKGDGLVKRKRTDEIAASTTTTGNRP